MTVLFLGEKHECIRAIKNGKSATLFLSDGGTAVFDGVNDWSAFSIEGGEWEEPPKNETEQLRSDVNELQEALNMILTGATE